MNVEPCKEHDPQYIVKNGRRKTKFGFTQKFMCLKCYHKFSLGVLKYNNKKDAMREFIREQYKSGFASRTIAKQIFEKFGVKISYGTVLKWVELPSKWMNNDQYKKIQQFNIGQLEIRIRKARKRIDEELYMIKSLQKRKRAMEVELYELDNPPKARNKNHKSIKK